MANDDLPPSLMPDSTQIPSGTMIIDGTYRIEKHLNTGGMGEVYRGENVHLGEPVAIKVVLPALAHDPKIVSLFQKEAAVLRRLNHEAIVRYEGFFVDSGIKRPCLVMEFVEGVSLADHLHHGPMAVDQVFTLIERVASGLAAAHKLGVVHRDLSPDNVILQDGAVENAKIIDFGIAKAANVGKGRTLIGDNFAGKFGYVAPEQLGKYNREVTARSDIYALGLLAAAACRGEPLDMGDDFYLALERRNTVPDLTGVDPAIRPLVEWMLQPDPKDRPQDMNAVLAALPGAAQGTRPPGTMPPPASLPPHTMPPVSAPLAPEPSVPPASLAPAPPPSAPPMAPPETTTLASAPPASVPPPQTTTIATAPPAAPPSVPPAAPPETTTLASIPPAAPRAPTVFMPSAPPAAAPPASAPPAATAFMPTPPARSVPPAAPAGQGSESPFGATPAPAVAPAAAPLAPAPAKGGRGGLMAAVAVVGLAAVGGGLWFGGVIPHGGSTPAGQTAAVKPAAQPPVTPPPATQTPVEKPAEPAKPAAEPPAPPPAPVQQAAQQPQAPAPEPAKPEPAKPEPPKTEQPKPEPAKTAALSPLQQSLNAFGTQACAFAEPVGSSGAVTAYAGKAMTVAALQRTLTGVEGKVPDLTAHLVNEAQCPVLQLAAAARSTGAAATPISVTLDRTMLANADRITGSVAVPAGQPVALLMIDGNGIAYNLTAGLTRQADGRAGFSTSFSLPALGNRPRRMPLLFLAATSAGPFDAAGVGAASSAQAVGPALKDALAKGAQIAIGFAQFTFR